MHFNPVTISLNGFKILFKILFTYCAGVEKLVIFVPEWYLAKVGTIKYVDPSRGRQLRDYSEQVTKLCPERQKYFEDLKRFYQGGKRVYQGELPEMKLYVALQTYYNAKIESVAIFHGIDILKMNLEKLSVSEKDFVIINATCRCITVIEVKNALGAGQSVEKSIKQLKEAKKDLEAWFSTEGLEHWVYNPMIYTEENRVQINCSECKKFIIVGMKNIYDK